MVHESKNADLLLKLYENNITLQFWLHVLEQELKQFQLDNYTIYGVFTKLLRNLWLHCMIIKHKHSLYFFKNMCSGGTWENVWCLGTVYFLGQWSPISQQVFVEM